MGIQCPKAAWLWCDNIGATCLSANPIFRARTKHLEVDYHFVTDQVSQKFMEIQFVPTGDQVVDGFTKPLSARGLEEFKHNLNIGKS